MEPNGTHLLSLVFCVEALSKTHVSGFHKTGTHSGTHSGNDNCLKENNEFLEFDTHWNPLEPIRFQEASNKTIIFTSRTYSYYNTK